MYRSFLAVRYVRTRFVNLISIGGVMFGVAVLIVVTAVMDGFQERVRTVVRGNLAHLTLTPTGEAVPDLATVTRELKQGDSRIVGVAPEVGVPVGYFFNGGQRGAMSLGGRQIFVMNAVGLEWEEEQRVAEELVRRHGPKARDGSFRLIVSIDPGDPFVHARGPFSELDTALISRAFAYAFLLQIPPTRRPAPGSAADVELLRPLLNQDRQFEVLIEEPSATGQSSVRHVQKRLVFTGVYDGGDQAEDRGRLLLRRSAVVAMTQMKVPYQELRVWIDDYAQAAEVKAAVLARFPGFYVLTWEEQREDFLRAVKTEKVLLVIVLSFIVLLGGFIILATLTLTVVEKTRDIGVLAALGASRAGILSIFLRNGFFIGVVGALLGLLLGWLFVHNINDIKNWLDRRNVQLFPPDIYLFTEIPTVWSWVSVVTIMAGSVGVAFVAGLLPALRAARLDPIVALRHE